MDNTNAVLAPLVSENVKGGLWSLTAHYGRGDEARDAMRKQADALRQPTQTDNNFHKLSLSGSFERVAKVSKEREAFNEAMATAETDRLERELDITNADHIALWLEANVIPHDALRLCLNWLAVQIVEAHEAALRQPTQTDDYTRGFADGLENVARINAEEDAFRATQTDALREALEAAPIISQWEGPAEFRARQDEWLQGKYKAALEASNG